MAKAALVALACLAAARAGLALPADDSSVTAISAPSGIALAALLLGGPRLWPGVAIGALVAGAWTGLPALAVLAITTGTTLQALAAVRLLRAARFRPALERVRDVLALVVAAGLSALVGAATGIAALDLAGETATGGAGAALRTWWLADMGGDLLVAPLLLVLARMRPSWLRMSRARALEAAALAAAAAGLTLAVFSGEAPLAYLVLALPVWAAVRFRQAGAVLVSFAVAATVVASSTAGTGPFSQAGPDVGLLMAQTFVASGAVIGLLLAAVTAERGHARDALLSAHAALQAQVQRRTAAMERIHARLAEAHEIAQIGSWEWDVPSDSVTWSDELYRNYGADPAAHEATFGGYLERVHPDDRDRVAAQVGAALADRDAFRFDERIVRPDGTVRTLASRGQVHRDGDGQPLRMVGICQDVTESRRAERALRASEERARLILDAASDAFVATDEHDTIVDWNQQAQALLGWTREEALGSRLGELIVPARNRPRHRAALADFAATGKAPWRAGRLRRTALHRDGHEFAVELSIAPVAAEDGTVFNFFVHDITERLRAERYLATEHAVSRVLLESRTVDEARPLVLEAFGAGMDWAVGGWWEVDDDGATVRCARFWQAAHATGAEPFEQATTRAALEPGVGVPGRVWQSGQTHVLTDVGTDANFLRRDGAAQAGLRAGIAVPLRSRGRTVAVIEFYATGGLHLGDGLAEMMARLCDRVAQFVERTAAEKDLREAEERFHRAFADAGTGMAIIGVRGEEDGRFIEVNDRLCSFLRRPREELLGTAIADIVHPDDVDDATRRIRRLVDGEIDSAHSEGRLLDAAGEVVWISFSTSVVRDAGGEPLYRISQMQDVTERRRFERQLQHLADHDPITGLFNRRRFDEELARELASARRYHTGGAVLALDLDNFKYVNDTLGHNAGDELIACVAELLRGRLRETDTIARLGGDEFAVILPHVDEHQASRVAGDLLAAIRSDALVSTPKGSRRTTASIGIALFGDPHRLASEELLVEADIAMYDAKEAGRDQACVFDADSSRQLSLEARMTWSDEIRAALAEDRFTLYAQPIVPLQGGSPRHELLVRMLSRDGDIVPPGAFLPIAERFDLVQDIDRWVVSRAIELLGEHGRAGDDVRFEVNLSAKSLGQADLPAQIARQLAAHDVDPGRLVFEVTETAAIGNLERAKQFANRLAELGCGFALDDFGAGFASFYYLKHLPFDYLKIDGEFVESLRHSTTNQLVVQSLVTIARGLGKQTIAEYVGDEATVELLREYGVDFAQGFHVGRPRPVAEIAPSRAGEAVARMRPH